MIKSFRRRVTRLGRLPTGATLLGYSLIHPMKSTGPVFRTSGIIIYSSKLNFSWTRWSMNRWVAFQVEFQMYKSRLDELLDERVEIVCSLHRATNIFELLNWKLLELDGIRCKFSRSRLIKTSPILPKWPITRMIKMAGTTIWIFLLDVSIFLEIWMIFFKNKIHK